MRTPPRGAPWLGLVQMDCGFGSGPESAASTAEARGRSGNGRGVEPDREDTAERA